MKKYEVCFWLRMMSRVSRSKIKNSEEKKFIDGGEMDVQLKLKQDEQISSFEAWSE